MGFSFLPAGPAGRVARSSHLWVAVSLAAACAVACGSGDGGGSSPPSSASPDDGGAPAVTGDGGASLLGPQEGGLVLGSATVTSIAVTPAAASIESSDGAPVTQALTVTAHYSDGTSGPLTSGLTWSAGEPQVGAISGAGLYSASGSIGGVVPISVAYGGLHASASLTVKLLLHAGSTTVASGAAAALVGATTPDASVTWAYPYNGTVFPRGLMAPVLMWNGGGAADAIYVHVTSPTFELKAFAPAPATSARFTFDPTIWQRLVDSTSGATSLTVARWNGAAATVIASHTWTIAPASMRGTIYYWAQNIGRVVRIKPGASAPDDFANAPPLNNAAVYPSSSCLMTCHTVSADGTTLVSGGGSFGGSFSLVTGTPMYSLGGVWGGGANGGTNDAQVIQWSNPALTPDGKYIVENQLASQLSVDVSGPTIGGMFKTSDGTAVPTSGVPSEPVFMPSFSPDGSKMVYVAGSAAVPGNWISSVSPGALRVMDFKEGASPMLSGARDLVQPGSDPAYTDITWPTVSPDGHWALYTRSNGTVIDSRGNYDSASGYDYSTRGDMYLADTTKPNSEIRLAALNGDSYPFAAGARDLHYNYEPTFAPVAAGGYYWVVFTSRRTYGNALAGSPGVTKQLWVAAIDQNPAPGKDPSHAAFLLAGQDETTLNLRGFWALDPCKGAGQGCASGTECCGGYCDASGDGGAPVCSATAPACANDGDKCATTSDCCGAAAGTTCINKVCSEPAPK